MGLQVTIPFSPPPWQLGGASLSRASAASYKISRAPSLVSLARASSSSDKSKSSSSESGTFLFIPLEDVGYVVKLTVGSVVGAAAVKYGSVLLPDSTRPNFVEALFIMGSPVMVAVALLAVASFKQSRPN